MQIGLEPAVLRLQLEAQRVSRPGRDPVVDIGPKIENLPPSIVLDPELDGEERNFFDDQADLLHRGDQKVLVALPL